MGKLDDDTSSLTTKSTQFEMNPTKVSFGTKTGEPFDEITDFRSIGLRSNESIDCLIVDNEEFGGAKGNHSTLMGFGEDEYISAVSVGWGSRVFSLRFVTNKGKSIHGGQGGSGSDVPVHNETYNNIRVVGISGNSDDHLNCLTISFLPAPCPTVDGAISTSKSIAETKPMTLHFGKGEGTKFQGGNPQSIKLVYDSVIDSIILDGEKFGGSGGNYSTMLEMADGEYISAFSVGWGGYDYVFSLRLTTNMGRSIHGGWGYWGKDRPTHFETYNSIRVVGISGRYKDYLTQISISFVPSA